MTDQTKFNPYDMPQRIWASVWGDWYNNNPPSTPVVEYMRVTPPSDDAQAKALETVNKLHRFALTNDDNKFHHYSKIDGLAEEIRAYLQSCLDDGWNFNMDEAPRHQTDDQLRIRILATDGNEIFSCRWTYRFSLHFKDQSEGWYSDVANDRVHPIAWKPFELPTPPEKGQP